MKRIMSLVLAFALIFSLTTAFADARQIDGTAKRDIKINKAGLNEDPDEMIMKDISPTTGRTLSELSIPDGYLGAAAGLYTPVMVMISNADGGVNVNDKGYPQTAPINGRYADVVYEAPQATSGGAATLTRMAMIFSDVIPDYVGFVRSTRLTHVRLRQEWDCAFCTSGYADYVTDEWKKVAGFNPMAPSMADKLGPAYVGGVSSGRPWKKYVWRVSGIGDANSEVFELNKVMLDCYMKSGLTAANHTWKFTDDVPEGGDDAGIVYVKYGGDYKTDSRLEYDEDLNAYIRYVTGKDGKDKVYKEQLLVNPEIKKVNGSNEKKVVCDERVFGEEITFNNVIVQSIQMKWLFSEAPDPVLTGTGNADYFMGGKHYEGVWERETLNDRTVFYDKDGNEIEMQRGRTLIILMDYSAAKSSVSYEE